VLQPKTRTGETISSRLFPIFEVQGHGSQWKPVLRTGHIRPQWKGWGDDQGKDVAHLETYTFPKHPYKDWAKSYIEVVEKLFHMPGASYVCDDLMEKVATKTEEIIYL